MDNLTPTSDHMRSPIDRQRSREEYCHAVREKKYWESLSKRGAQDSTTVRRAVEKLVEPISVVLHEGIYGQSHKASKSGTLTATLRGLDVDTDELAMLTLRAALHSVERNTALSQITAKLGYYVEEHIGWSRARGADGPYIKAVEESLKKSTSEHHSRAVVRHVLRKRSLSLGWDDETRTKVGAYLLTVLVSASAHFTVVTVGRRRQTREFLRVSDELMDMLKAGHAREILLRPFHLPMCVKPLPWVDGQHGGYLLQECHLVKRRENMDLPIEAAPEVFQACNKLSQTGWRINKAVYAVMESAWREGAQIGKLPAQDDLPLPTQPWGDREPTDEELTEWKYAASRVHEDNARLRSKRLGMLSKLSQAETLLDDEAFYYVYSMDWRGRFYPLGGGLTPQADDSGKALLEFAEGKRLGKGWYWLAVHLANTFGYDKVSNDRRVEWALEHSEAINASAIMPLNEGDQLWLKADKPWQFLAACMEWLGYQLQGEDFVTHLPVAQDGSANGLQHFAALLRDQQSAEAVNLAPADKPADIYQRVADRVQELLQEATPSDETVFWNNYEGDWRGLVKRPVMTVPYGVSSYGIRQQLVGEMVKRHGPDDWLPRCGFLAGLVEQAIGDVVAAATLTMGWLQEVAALVSEQEHDLSWVTPCDLPVTMRYRRPASRRVDLRVWVGGQKKVIRRRASVSYETDVVDARKAVNGISPHFVHSLDAAHLVKTVNLTLASSLAMVHDSYATHACDVAELGLSLRAAFVKLHEQPILADFKDHVESTYQVALPDLPGLGDFNLRSVLDAEYFFA